MAADASLRRRTSIGRLLAFSLILVTLVPFLPLAILTYRAYRADVALLEQEIRATNRQTALLAASLLDGIVRQVRDDLLIAITGRVHWTSDPFPPPVAGVRWEALDRNGVVVASELSTERIGRPAGYERLTPPTIGGGRPEFSAVGRVVPGFPPTCVLVQQVDTDRLLAAVLDPEGLRRHLATLAPGLDRHIYAADRNGRLLFYSDAMVTERGEDLSANPPVRLFVGGGAGEIRFRSIVSRKERLGFVQPVGGTTWGVVVSADIATSVLAVRDRYAMLALSIGFAIAAALGILMWSSRRLTRPLAEIRVELRRWREGSAGPRRIAVPEPRIAEYRDLVDALNDLSRRLAATEAELVQAAKASLTGQLASGIAHEIGTPLNVISGSAQYTLRKLGDDDPCKATLQVVVRQTERISTMVQRFLEFSRTPEARLASVDVAEVARQVVAMVPEINRNVATTLAVDPRTPPVLGDPKLLEHALMNLILNGCQAMPGGGALAITIGVAAPSRTGVDTTRPWIRVCVADTGCGIAAEHLGRVFEPFFTTKPLGEGTGLGLAIVDRIAERHGGWIEATSTPGAGSVFMLWLRPAGENR